jgi:glycosyltransferase involved in cell wall biosynthesis
MKILVILNYYYPYVSGLSEYARLLCEELSMRGHEVTVLAGNHANLKEREIINGVKVVRAPILLKISKGTVSTKFITWARELAKKADVVNMHLPMLESGVIASIIPKKKLICTYHCDINLPNGFINNMIVKIMDTSCKQAFKRADSIVVNTIEYMEKSRIADKYITKMSEIAPPIKRLPIVQHHNNKKFIIGFCGRLVEEKGIDVLIKAFELLKREMDDVELVIGGDYKTVAGGSVYPRLKQYIDEHNIIGIKFEGKIPEEEMAEFYASLDVFVLPSINCLESFGMVQVEAMMCGTPVIASDLLGVRTIVGKTGMGLITKHGDAEDLKECIIKIRKGYDEFVKERDSIEDIYGIDRCISSYLGVMGGLN